MKDLDVENCKLNVALTYRPVQILLLIFGLHKFSYDNGKAVRPGKLSGVWCGALCVALLTMTVLSNKPKIIKLFESERNLPIVTYVIHVMLIFSSSITSSVAILSSKWPGNKFSTMINNFEDIDFQLDIRRKNLYMDTKFKLFCIEIIVVLISVGKYVNQYANNLDELQKTFFVLNVREFIIVLQILDFSCALWINITRLKALNEKLITLLDNIDDGSAIMFKQEFKSVNCVIFDEGRVSEQRLLKDQLLEFMKLFEVLADNILIMNDVFGTSILSTSVTVFLLILTTMNGLILIDRITLFYVNYTVTAFLADLLPICSVFILGAYLADNLNGELDKLASVVDKFSMKPSLGEAEYDLLNCFSQMLSGRNVYITANYFFNYDLSFICTLIGAAGTYSVILLQVNNNQKAINKKSNQ